MVRTLPVIETVHQLPHVKIHIMMINPPTVISFEFNTLNVLPEFFQYEWLQSVTITVLSIK